MTESSRSPRVPEAETKESSRVPRVPKDEMTRVFANPQSTKSWNDSLSPRESLGYQNLEWLSPRKSLGHQKLKRLSHCESPVPVCARYERAVSHRCLQIFSHFQFGEYFMYPLYTFLDSRGVFAQNVCFYRSGIFFVYYVRTAVVPASFLLPPPRSPRK